MNKVDISSLKNNIFDEFNKGWALLSAGNKENFNAMTISWGQCGYLWHRNIITVYVRPNRYTKEYLDNKHQFSVPVEDKNGQKEEWYLVDLGNIDQFEDVKALNDYVLTLTSEFKDEQGISLTKRFKGQA